MDRRALRDDEMFIALPKAHPLAAKSALRLEELRDESFIQGTLPVLHEVGAAWGKPEERLALVG